MLFALDYNDKRVHIDNTHSNKEYFCPYCGAPLTIKKGDTRQHHFAHRMGHYCSDAWAVNHYYDISPWHNEWQECYPSENQEVRLVLGKTVHRADVLTGRSVVEFQHSILSSKVFDDRNNFYFNLGYKVIWLFDLTKEIKNDDIKYRKDKNRLIFNWNNPKKAFNCYDIKTGCIDLFFQIDASDCDKIVHVTDVSEDGYEEFYTSDFMNKNDFLIYTGLKDGKCLAPDRADAEANRKYAEFKTKYNISLNGQQERAVQTVEGANLLLAVPGSGKTTVLVSRLGYMIMEKGIAPENILAITYTKNAAEEMKSRFCKIFDAEIGKRIDFRTINSLSLEIYTQYCKEHNYPKRELIKLNNLRKFHKNIYSKLHDNEIASESDIIDLETMISYAKNMMFDDKQLSEIDSNYPLFSDMYNAYKKQLDENSLMDYDDQMFFAYWILKNRENERKYWQNKYKYICVDEAQDTSKIQHEIIKILAQGNNIFMVGDEDQSIYGFRAAYPKALLNFRVDYINPYILRMERNYRSTKQIVDIAHTFISANKGRYDKNMISDRGDGQEIDIIKVPDVESQYIKAIAIAKEVKEETAFLYRDNESAVVMVDLLLRSKIDFYMKKPELNYFNCKVVREIIDYLTLTIDPFAYNAFSNICNHGIIYLKKQQKEYAINNSKIKHISIFDAIDEQMKYVKYDQKNQGENFRNTINSMAQKTPYDAIDFLFDMGYEKYVKKRNYDTSKIITLKILAKQETDIKKFLSRVKELEMLIKKGFNKKEETYLTLSTIHSSKGLEYKNVYMIDIYDGRFPSSKKNIFNRSKDNANDEQEERRMFYVGITRAKDYLSLFYIKNQNCSYVEELFPELKEQKIKEIEKQKQQSNLNSDNISKQHENQCVDVVCFSNKVNSESANNPAKIHNVNIAHESFGYKTVEEIRKQRNEARRKREEIRRQKEEIRKKREEELFNEGYIEVKDKFNQETEIIFDSNGNRWVKCTECGLISTSNHFVKYGGAGAALNFGLCENCERKKERIKKQTIN